MKFPVTLKNQGRSCVKGQPSDGFELSILIEQLTIRLSVVVTGREINI